MLPPIEMLAKKNRMSTGLLVGLLLSLFAAGCAPSGSRALLNGKRLLEAGDYTGAVEELRTATTLLPKSAGAWNYLGVAYQKAQQPENAAAAYEQALALNRDLVEVHWNLGMLNLEQNKNEQALSEFTMYTLRRPNAPEGWLKLGAAQLRLGQIPRAEASFSWVLRLDPGNAEAMVGLGLARIERNRPRDAIQFFAQALHDHPGDAPAMLNLAITEQTYLHDNRTALQYYQEYLALTPRPENYDAVNAEVNSLGESLTASAQLLPPAAEEAQPPPAAAPVATPTPAPAAAQPVPTTVAEMRRFVPPPVVHSVPATKPQVVARSTPPPVVVRTAPPVAAPVVRSQPVVQTQFVASAPPPRLNPAPPQVAPAATAEPEAKPGFWDKVKPNHWLEPAPADKKYENSGVTPLPTIQDSQAAETASEQPVRPSAFPRYGYLSPARPEPGDRRAASGSFTSARVFEQEAHFVDAMQAYHSAAEFDPSWYEAQYNYAVLCYRLGDYRQALGAYEMALAIQPNSADARYNFALALKGAGYVPDALNELRHFVEAHPDEVRGQLALANLYAQKLHDTAQARDYYRKVLELEPDGGQAAEIRSWLAAHSN